MRMKIHPSFSVPQEPQASVAVGDGIRADTDALVLGRLKSKVKRKNIKMFTPDAYSCPGRATTKRAHPVFQVTRINMHKTAAITEDALDTGHLDVIVVIVLPRFLTLAQHAYIHVYL